MDESSTDSAPPPARSPEARLESWKEIAVYLNRDVSTVQRWEKREGMPVHRHVHDKLGSVYALRSELDAWSERRNLGPSPEHIAASVGTVGDESGSGRQSMHRRLVVLLLAFGAVLGAGAFVLLLRTDYLWRNPIAAAQFQQLTNFEGTAGAAAISRDGKFVAFLSDRDGRVDVWVTQVGTGRFYNLTRGSASELVNPSVRTIGFSPDGSSVLFWTRRPGASSSNGIGIWAVPTLGGAPRPYLDGAAEADWTGDGSRLVYHTPEPSDPMFVKEASELSPGRGIFSAPPGLHSHFPSWSRDGAFIYFVQGSVPDRMDIWRIPHTGGSAERITFHDSRVSHPVLLDGRTLVYLAIDAGGSGPWLYSVDPERRSSHRISSGLDRYSSLAASADGRRLVATVARSKETLWRVPIASTVADESNAVRIPLTTGPGFSPRLGPDYVLYVSSTGNSEGIWKLSGGASQELWSAPGARILGGPAVASDGLRVAFAVAVQNRVQLRVMNADGTDARVVTDSIVMQGAPTWAPDGRSLTLAAVDKGVPRLLGVSLDGHLSRPLAADYALEPAWSPDGRILVYSGPDVGTTFGVKAVTADGNPYPLPNLTLTRGARRLRFLPGHRALVALQGEIEHKNFWLIDLNTGTRRQLTNFGNDFVIHDFDVSFDGREIVFDRTQENSDIVLLDIPAR